MPAVVFWIAIRQDLVDPSAGRYRWFESTSLQQGVCELSVPGQREIAVASSGRVAYAWNTGHDSLSAALFSVMNIWTDVFGSPKALLRIQAGIPGNRRILPSSRAQDSSRSQ